MECAYSFMLKYSKITVCSHVVFWDCHYVIRHSSGICQNCLRILVDRKAVKSCFFQFPCSQVVVESNVLLFFMRKKEKRQGKKNSITYYRPSSFVLWLAAAMFSGTIVVTVEKPQLPSSQFPFFWLECCWPKQYCTVMHFAYFLSGFYISNCYLFTLF